MFNLFWEKIKKIFNLAKKIFLVFVIYYLVISLFLSFIQQNKFSFSSDLTQESQKEIYKLINDPQLNKTQSGKIKIFIYRSFLCNLIGEACTNNPNDAKENFHHSIIGFFANLIILPYAHPPASAVYWAYSTLENAGFVTKTYAAEGIGFAAIKPFMNLWKAFRDIAYMLLVLIMISIGFMIMFRMKLNPQTVITVENALPGVVVALLLVTFSFAIAGFLIDLMYVLIVIGISLIVKVDPKLSAMQLQNQFLNSNMGTIWDSMFIRSHWVSNIPLLGGLYTYYALGNAFVQVLPQWIDDFIRGISAALLTNAVLTFLLEKFGLKKLAEVFDNVDIVGNSFGLAPGAVIRPTFGGILLLIVLSITLVLGPGFIIGLIIAFTLVGLLFRITFTLFYAYLKILLMIIFSPLFMLFQALPGKNTFSYWFKNLFIEILTFPVTIILLVIGKAIVGVINNSQTGIWRPPFLWGIEAKSFSIIIGMGIIFMIPDIIKVLKELLGAKEMPIGLNLGVFFAGAASGVAGGLGLFSQFASIAQGLNLILGQQRFSEIMGKILPFIPPSSGTKPSPGNPQQALGGGGNP